MVVSLEHPNFWLFLERLGGGDRPLQPTVELALGIHVTFRTHSNIFTQ